jgi:hypothetical protein
MEQQYEGTYTVSRRPRRLLPLVGIGFLVLIALVAYAAGRGGGYQERSRDAATGTSGKVSDLASGHSLTQVPAGAVINELETITGAVDGHELIGRRVSLRVNVGDQASSGNARGRFWIGPADSPMLVVLDRDVRNERQRVEGDPSNNSFDAVRAGRSVMISGKIEPLPRAEERYSWGLTRDELEQLTGRPIYIRADSVHGVS